MEEQNTIVPRAEQNSTLSYQIQKNKTQNPSRGHFLLAVICLFFTNNRIVNFWIFLWYRNGKNNAPMVLPDKVIVVCSGIEGIYFPSHHL